MIGYIKEKWETFKLASKIKSLKKEVRSLRAEVKILKSVLRMHEASGKKNATFL